jgi:hypothetical protein
MARSKRSGSFTDRNIFGFFGGGGPSSEPPGEPPGDEDEDERQPLGVDRDYRAVVPREPSSFAGSARQVEGWSAGGAGPGTPHEVGPRYWDDDQFKPAQGSPDAIVQLQQDMVRAGLISSGARVRLGTWDMVSITAYEQLLGLANVNGIPANMMLDRLIAGSAEGSGLAIDPRTGEVIEGGGGFVPPEALPVRLPSRDDMRAVTRAAVIDALGQGWSQDQIDGFVDNYYAYAQSQAQTAYNQEVERQRAAFESGQPTTNVNVELDMTSPEVALDETLRRDEPNAYAAGQIANEFAPAFFQALGGYQ